MSRWFDPFARTSAHVLATPQAFIVFWLIIGAWHVLWWSLGWEAVWVDRLTLYLSIGTQASAQLIRYAEEQNSIAQQAKTDELIRALPQARNDMIGIEEQTPPG
jgi:low affinity Fe/Cu permease